MTYICFINLIDMSTDNKTSTLKLTGNNSHSRRKFISAAASGAVLIGLQGSGASVRPLPQILNELPAVKKLKIVIAGGHPGDPEYGCGGTAALYTDMGHEVVFLYLNRGEGGIEGKSGSEAAAVRTAEALSACRMLNTRAVFASQIDGQAIVDASHYDEFYRILESEQPDIIFTQWPIDNHRDHRAISTLVYDAWLKLGKSPTSKHPDLYYYEVSDGEDTFMFSPTYYVDITAVEARKRAACYVHVSQSPDMFYSLQEQISKFRGIERGCKHAEAFIRHVISHCDIQPPLR
jgi:LmbE family N-acetylglucosaminyl deacetylase